VLCRDTSKFKTVFPSVVNVYGPLNFGLGSTGDQLRLLNTDNSLHTSVLYSGTTPWPAKPDDNGETLELLDPFANLDNASNWFVGCFGGSPEALFTSCANT